MTWLPPAGSQNPCAPARAAAGPRTPRYLNYNNIHVQLQSALGRFPSPKQDRTESADGCILSCLLCVPCSLWLLSLVMFIVLAALVQTYHTMLYLFCSVCSFCLCCSFCLFTYGRVGDLSCLLRSLCLLRLFKLINMMCFLFCPRGAPRPRRRPTVTKMLLKAGPDVGNRAKMRSKTNPGGPNWALEAQIEPWRPKSSPGSLNRKNIRNT